MGFETLVIEVVCITQLCCREGDYLKYSGDNDMEFPICPSFLSRYCFDNARANILQKQNERGIIFDKIIQFLTGSLLLIFKVYYLTITCTNPLLTDSFVSLIHLSH